MGLAVEQALNILIFSKKRAAVLVKKTLDTAIANAENNEGADIEELRVSSVCVDEVPTMKRMCACVKGWGIIGVRVKLMIVLLWSSFRR